MATHDSRVALEVPPGWSCDCVGVPPGEVSNRHITILASRHDPIPAARWSTARWLHWLQTGTQCEPA